MRLGWSITGAKSLTWSRSRCGQCFWGRAQSRWEFIVQQYLNQWITVQWSQVALYGLSHVKDERLHRLFRENKVEFELPLAEEGRWAMTRIWLLSFYPFFQGVVPYLGAASKSSQAWSNKFYPRVVHPRFFPPGYLGPWAWLQVLMTFIKIQLP